MILQFGVPPNRNDLINIIENVSFSEAWKDKISEKIPIRDQKILVHFIGLEQLIKNKEALERPKDIEDLKYLKKQWKRKKDAELTNNKSQIMDN